MGKKPPGVHIFSFFVLTVFAGPGCTAVRESWGASTRPNSRADFVQLLCGDGPLPEPGSLVDFIGPLQRANTTRYSFGYFQFGNATADRPPLVLIPGLGATISMWTPASMRAVAAQQEIFALDNPCNGFTEGLLPEACQSLSILGMAEDILEFIQGAGLDRPNVLGSSMGGFIATAMAATAGDRVGKVVVAPGSAGSPNSQYPRADLVEKLESGTLGALDVIAASYPLDLAEGVEGMCRCQYDGAGGIIDPGNPAALGLQAQAVFDYFDGTGVWDLLPNISNPLLLVGGKLDPVVPVQNVVAIAGRVQEPWLAVYPRASHAAACQELESFLNLLENFLEHA